MLYITPSVCYFFLLANGLSFLCIYPVYLLYSSSLRLQSSPPPPISLFHLPLCPFHLYIFPVEFGGETHKSCWANDLLDGSTMLHLVHYVYVCSLVYYYIDEGANKKENLSVKV
ncbi:hypothetical protein DAPPUDRAFT_305275 [Daphnia pulex]|uniref:Uncharacterized protein n=1 Tax=Daphnia pulex TaxID=6669 RepID=E9GRB8_DAPPU|nr:hypothetical protein DAPPUDRAFT_305275 [Daphnia pulex]|eukprot:EFX77984.1 hypothetical protein DAPPUDRAFT_305275 [Daphnia pulex]